MRSLHFHWLLQTVARSNKVSPGVLNPCEAAGPGRMWCEYAAWSSGGRRWTFTPTLCNSLSSGLPFKPLNTQVPPFSPLSSSKFGKDNLIWLCLTVSYTVSPCSSSGLIMGSETSSQCFLLLCVSALSHQVKITQHLWCIDNYIFPQNSAWHVWHRWTPLHLSENLVYLSILNNIYCKSVTHQRITRVK